MIIPFCGYDFNVKTDSTLKTHAALSGDEIVKTLNDSQYTIPEIILVNRFRAKFHYYKMTRVLTRFGFCFSFNMMDYSDIFNDQNLSKDFDSFKSNLNSSYDSYNGYRTQDIDAYPNRIFSGQSNSLTFLLVSYKHDEDAACSGPRVGFRIFWHSPYEIPQLSHRNVYLRPDNDFNIFMKAIRIKTSKDLIRYGYVTYELLLCNSWCLI